MGLPGETWASSQDEVHIMQAARGDLAQFAPLYDRYFPRIYRYCLRRVDDAEAAEDLTSIIFTRALNSVSDYAGGSFAAWLFRIAHNAVANYYRGRRPHVSFEQIELPAENAELVESVVATEQIATLNALVRKLSSDQQELLALKIAGGLTAEEIGIILGKSAGAVRVELHRVIQKLRTQYEGLA